MIQFFNLLFLFGAICIFSCQDSKNSTDTRLKRIADPQWAAIEIPATANDPMNREDVAKISFSNYHHDFGKVQEGKKVHYDFTYYNTGKLPLLITRAIGSCGCTRAEFSDKTLAPGDSAVLRVFFNAEGRNGLQEKTVTVEANTYPTQTEIGISCDVINVKQKQ